MFTSLADEVPEGGLWAHGPFLARRRVRIRKATNGMSKSTIHGAFRRTLSTVLRRKYVMTRTSTEVVPTLIGGRDADGGEAAGLGGSLSILLSPYALPGCWKIQSPTSRIPSDGADSRKGVWISGDGGRDL